MTQDIVDDTESPDIEQQTADAFIGATPSLKAKFIADYDKEHKPLLPWIFQIIALALPEIVKVMKETPATESLEPFAIEDLPTMPTLVVLMRAIRVQNAAILEFSKALGYGSENALPFQEKLELLDAVLEEREQMLMERRTSEVDWPAHDLEQAEQHIAAATQRARDERDLTDPAPAPDHSGEESTTDART